MFERFTQPARTVVVEAQVEARRLQHRTIGTEHLLLALLRDRGVEPLLTASGLTVERVDAAIVRLRGSAGSIGRIDFSAEEAAALLAVGIDIDEVRARIEENFGPVPPPAPGEPPRRWFGLRRGRSRPRPGSGHIPFSPRAKKVLELSLREALRLKHRFIGSEHILLGLLRENGGLGALVLSDAGVDHADLRARAEASVRAYA